MSTNVNIYSPNDITVTLTRGDGFAHIVGGYSDGDMVSIEPAAEALSMYTSADNQMTLLFNANNSATVTLTLNQTSATNDVLSWLYEELKARKSPDKLFSVLIKDQNGRSLYTTSQAFIGKRPTASFSNSMNNREWTILCADMQQFAGGNARLSQADASSIAILGGTVEDRWVP